MRHTVRVARPHCTLIFLLMWRLCVHNLTRSVVRHTCRNHLVACAILGLMLVYRKRRRLCFPLRGPPRCFQTRNVFCRKVLMFVWSETRRNHTREQAMSRQSCSCRRHVLCGKLDPPLRGFHEGPLRKVQLFSSLYCGVQYQLFGLVVDRARSISPTITEFLDEFFLLCVTFYYPWIIDSIAESGVWFALWCFMNHYNLEKNYKKKFKSQFWMSLVQQKYQLH